MCIKITWNLHHKLHDLFVIAVNKFFSDSEILTKIELYVDDVGDDGDLDYAVQMNEDKPLTPVGVPYADKYTTSISL